MTKLRVLFDDQIFMSQRVGGISRYFVEMLTRLSTIANIDPILPFWASGNAYLAEAPDSFRKRLIDSYEYSSSTFSTKVERKLNHIRNCLTIRAGQYDVLHATYYSPNVLRWISERPLVVTVYDMIHELFPESFDPNDQQLTARNKRILTRAATKVIAISEHTRKDLIRLHGIDPQKVTTVHLAPSRFPTATKPSVLPNKPFLLYIGKRSGYKNFAPFIRVLRDEIHNDLSVICAGGGAFTQEEQIALDTIDASHLVTNIHATDSELSWLYQHAIALVYPSLYEGFGLPITEAYAHSCPVICSNAGSLPEIAGEAALLFDPIDMSDIPDHIKNVRHPSIRNERISMGHKQLAKYSWEKCVRETAAIYQSLCQHKG